MMNFINRALWPSDSAQSFWTGAGALWIFSAAVSAMDPPRNGASAFYGWLYRFTHLLAANLDRALKPASLEAMSDTTTNTHS
jgi:hypothetical protein